MPLEISISYARAHVPFWWECEKKNATFGDLIEEMKKPMHKGWKEMMDADTLPAEEWNKEYDIFVQDPETALGKRVEEWDLDTPMWTAGIGKKDRRGGTATVIFMPRWIPDRPKHCTNGEPRVECRQAMLC